MTTESWRRLTWFFVGNYESWKCDLSGKKLWVYYEKPLEGGEAGMFIARIYHDTIFERIKEAENMGGRVFVNGSGKGVENVDQLQNFWMSVFLSSCLSTSFID